MKFKSGDWVVHRKHGLGQVKAIEEREMNGNAALPYYVVQVADLTIWVPADKNEDQRLRPPAGKAEFRDFLSILSSPAEALSSDRRQRGLTLMEKMEDGRVESLCRVIRDLEAFRRAKTWNEYDSGFMKRAQSLLVREWHHVLSVPPREAEEEMRRLLSAKRIEKP